MDRTSELTWVQEVPFGVTTRQVKSSRTRRSHTKSRSGCITCKRRKVKCGEERPVCSKCHSRQVDCIYPDAQATPKEEVLYPSPVPAQSPPVPSTSDLSYEACLSTQLFAASIARMANLSTISGKSSNSFVYILHHFEQTSYRTLATPSGQQVFHDKVPRMLMTYPFLLHTVIAFSASHLEYLSNSASKPERMTLIAAYHTQRAIDLYTLHLNVYKNDTPLSSLGSQSRLEEMDALVATCMMLNSLFYYMNVIDPPQSAWTLSPLQPSRECAQLSHEAGCSWLTKISGMMELLQLRQFRQRISQSSSCWFPVLTEAVLSRERMDQARGDGTNRMTHVQHGLAAVDPGKAVPALFNLVLSGHKPEYSTALSMLTPLLGLDPSDLNNFGRFIPFPAMLSNEFVKLVNQRPPDPIALLILGHWFVRMGQVPHWWCKTRGQSEAMAIAWYVDAVAHPAVAHLAYGGVEFLMRRRSWDKKLHLLECALQEFKETVRIETEPVLGLSEGHGFDLVGDARLWNSIPVC